VSDGIRPAVQEMDSLSLGRNSGLVQEILKMGLQFKNGPIKEENEED
jgi:hypothetical protein